MSNFSFKHGIFFSVLVVGLGTFALSADGDTKVIPDWVKNTAKWWADDQISETEYISSLQYMIDQNIISVDSSISSVYATEVSISNEERAQSFEVRFISKQYDMDETIHSFVQFINRNEASGQPSGVLSSLPKDPEFLLGSLPSSDKMTLYKHIQRTLEPGAQTQLLEIDVDVSVFTGNGEKIQTWEYRDCSLSDYVLFLNSDKRDYNWSQEEGSEIRELFFFECLGIDFIAGNSD